MDQVAYLPLWSFDVAASGARPALARPAKPASSRRQQPHADAEDASGYRTQARLAMERYARGEDAAFQELYSVLAPRLYRQCVYLVGSSDAEELLQEVFLKIHRARASFVPGGSVIAWASAIARSTCLDRLRHKRRRPEQILEPSQLDVRSEAQAHCPEGAAHESALAALVSQQLAQVSETLRSAYVLVRIEGFSCAEAGAALGVSVSAVKQRVHRASEQLKTALSGRVED